MTTEQVSGELVAPDQSDALASLDAEAWDILGRLAQSLHLSKPDLPQLLEAVLRSVTELLPRATAAGLNLIEHGEFRPQAVYGSEPPVLDQLQQRTGAGPCLEASASQQVVHIRDTRDDARWPEFGDLAQSIGVRAMLCVPLSVNDLRLGSLSVYFAAPTEYRSTDEQLARILGAQAALAIAGVQRSENLSRALENRDVIGQAKGILMERLRITADEAFALLTRASQNRNTKLAVVAEEFVLTGDLGLPGLT